ncbi:MAG: hypothetical protein ACW974_05700, partial [Candidatus Thorarchaeota archaeon]
MMQAFSDPSLNALFIIIIVGGSIACGIRSTLRRRGGGGSPAAASPEPTPAVPGAPTTIELERSPLPSRVIEDTGSISTIFTQTTSEGEAIEPVGRIGGFGALLGVAAAVLGIFMTGGYSLLPIPTIPVEVFQTQAYQIASSSFLTLLVAGLLLQGLGSRGLKMRLGSNYPNVIYLCLAVGALMVYSLLVGTIEVGSFVDRQTGFMNGFSILLALFAILWQLHAVMFTDTSKTWFGFLAGLMNGLFIPLIALGQVMGFGIVYLGYACLLIGQFGTFLYWWSPLGSIREYARSPSKAKLAFGISGFLTFLIGTVAIFVGPLTSIGDDTVWKPWSTLDPVQENMFLTNPALIFALCTSMMFWIMLAPRLGAKELSVAHIGDDIVRGGIKWFMVILASLGVVASAQAGTMLEGAEGAGLWLAIAPAAVMFLMGALYAATTDVITGVPLAITSIFIMVHPFALADFVIIPWIIVIITQGLLMVETIVRGLTSYSQGALSVILSIATSIVFAMFLLGGFGSGPAAIWPTNQWFNVRLFAGIPEAIQSPTVVALPALALLMRNVSLAGYSHGRGYTGGQMLMGVSVLFALMIPIIAFNESITHVTSTAAAVLLALYAVSFVLVLSLNMDLAAEVEDRGHAFEGQFIRISSVMGLLLGVGVGIIVLG